MQIRTIGTLSLVVLSFLGTISMSFAQTTGNPILIDSKTEVLILESFDKDFMNFSEKLGGCVKGDISNLKSCVCADSSSLQS